MGNITPLKYILCKEIPFISRLFNLTLYKTPFNYVWKTPTDGNIPLSNQYILEVATCSGLNSSVFLSVQRNEDCQFYRTLLKSEHAVGYSDYLHISQFMTSYAFESSFEDICQKALDVEVMNRILE